MKLIYRRKKKRTDEQLDICNNGASKESYEMVSQVAFGLDSLKDYREPSQVGLGLGLEEASAEPSIWYGAFDVILLNVKCGILRNLLNNKLWNNNIRCFHKMDYLSFLFSRNR